MAAGTPVIGTDVDGIRDVIQTKKPGFGAAPLTGDDRPCDRTADRQPCAADQLCEAGRIHVREHYAWPAILTQYDRLLSAANQPARSDAAGPNALAFG